MLHKPFGKTGKKISAVGCGGMRFANPQDIESNAQVVFHAYPAFDLFMLVYECVLDGPPRPVQVAEVAWVAPDGLTGYDLLPADRPLVERLAAAGGTPL